MATQYTAGITQGQVWTADIANQIGAAWETWTPTWSSTGTQPVLGNGAIYGRYQRIQKLVMCFIQLSPGSTTTFGTGVYLFTYPVTPIAPFVAYQTHGGTSAYFDASAAANYVGYPMYNASSTTTFQMGIVGGTDVTNTAPFTWANGDNLKLSFFYQAA